MGPLFALDKRNQQSEGWSVVDNKESGFAIRPGRRHGRSVSSFHKHCVPTATGRFLVAGSPVSRICRRGVFFIHDHPGRQNRQGKDPGHFVRSLPGFTYIAFACLGIALAGLSGCDDESTTLPTREGANRQNATGPTTDCSTDAQCWCREFNGVEFLPGKAPSRCVDGQCAVCLYD